MHALVGRADQPQVGVAVEHPQQEVGVAGLPQGEEPDRLAQGGVERLALGRDRAQASPVDPITISVQATTGRTA